jgi:hypothetical protein
VDVLRPLQRHLEEIALFALPARDDASRLAVDENESGHGYTNSQSNIVSNEEYVGDTTQDEQAVDSDHVSSYHNTDSEFNFDELFLPA